jgi:GTPase KRas protein
VAVDNLACVLEIMDTAGQDEFSALRDQYMKTGQGFVVVYSITSAASFEEAQNMRSRVLRIKEDSQVS